MIGRLRFVQQTWNSKLRFIGGFESAIWTPRKESPGSARSYKIFKAKICLNMNSKTDKEDRSCDDIAFLSEIITNSKYRHEIFNQFSILATGFIVVILFTILFGRIYCSSVCPLGTLQDIVSRFALFLNKNKYFRMLNNFKLLKYSILAVTVVSIFSSRNPWRN